MLKKVILNYYFIMLRGVLIFFLFPIGLLDSKVYAQNNKQRSFKKIIILNTKSNPKTNDFIKGINQSCKPNAYIIHYDMDGSSKHVPFYMKSIQKEIKSDLNSPPLLITLGGPATIIAQTEKLRTLVAYGMVGLTAKDKIKENNLIEINMDISYELRLRYFKSLLREFKEVVILHDEKLLPSSKAQIRQGAKKLALRVSFIKVFSPKDIPKALRTVTKLGHPVMFLPSKTIITRDSYQYITRILIENNIPSLVYSSALTKVGFLYSVEANYYAVGFKYGVLLCQEKTQDILALLKNYFPIEAQTSFNKKTGSLIHLVLDKK